jgi:hypothetical protein
MSFCVCQLGTQYPFARAGTWRVHSLTWRRRRPHSRRSRQPPRACWASWRRPRASGARSSRAATRRLTAAAATATLAAPTASTSACTQRCLGFGVWRHTKIGGGGRQGGCMRWSLGLGFSGCMRWPCAAQRFFLGPWATGLPADTARGCRAPSFLARIGLGASGKGLGGHLFGGRGFCRPAAALRACHACRGG